jgi:hypothetical protein
METVKNERVSAGNCRPEQNIRRSRAHGARVSSGARVGSAATGGGLRDMGVPRRDSAPVLVSTSAFFRGPRLFTNRPGRFTGYSESGISALHRSDQKDV